MRISHLTAFVVLLAMVIPAAYPTRAQAVCGGLVGISCEEESQFCQLPDGKCCCDFFGVCAGRPETCPDECDPVCGCDGVTYDTRCEASAVGASVAQTGPCDSSGAEVALIGFGSLQQLFWDPVPGALAYNVYLNDVPYYPPVFYGHCLYGAVPENSVLLQGNPDPGLLWLLQVTPLFPEGEGSMGLAVDCQPRTPAAPCTSTSPSNQGPCGAAFPRWFHNFMTGQCETFTGKVGKSEYLRLVIRPWCNDIYIHRRCTLRVGK